MAKPRRRITPQWVYWCRRALVVAVAVALVSFGFIVVKSMQLGSRAQAAVPATTEPTESAASVAPSPSAVPSTAASATTPSPAAESTAAPAAPTTPAAPPPEACDIGQLAIAVTGPARVRPGASAEFVVTFASSASAPCTLTLTSATFALVVTSGSDEIWASVDCAGWGPDTQAVVTPGVGYEWHKVWDRHRSDQCRVIDTTLASGTYVATAKLVDGPSAQYRFQLG